MSNLIFRLFRMYLRFVWFILAVLPGNLLIRLHSRALATRGRPQSALLPITFYRILGFVLTTVLLSFVNHLSAGSGGGG